MTRMTGPDCVVMCNLINTYIHTYIHTFRPWASSLFQVVSKNTKHEMMEIDFIFLVNHLTLFRCVQISLKTSHHHRAFILAPVQSCLGCFGADV